MIRAMKATITLYKGHGEWRWEVRCGDVHIYRDVRPLPKTTEAAQCDARRWVKRHMPHVEIEAE